MPFQSIYQPEFPNAQYKHPGFYKMRDNETFIIIKQNPKLSLLDRVILCCGDMLPRYVRGHRGPVTVDRIVGNDSPRSYIAIEVVQDGPFENTGLWQLKTGMHFDTYEEAKECMNGRKYLIYYTEDCIVYTLKSVEQ